MLLVKSTNFGFPGQENRILCTFPTYLDFLTSYKHTKRAVLDLFHMALLPRSIMYLFTNACNKLHVNLHCQALGQIDLENSSFLSANGFQST